MIQPLHSNYFSLRTRKWDKLSSSAGAEYLFFLLRPRPGVPLDLPAAELPPSQLRGQTRPCDALPRDCAFLAMFKQGNAIVKLVKDAYGTQTLLDALKAGGWKIFFDGTLA